jgi:hypothetical protein
MYNLNEWAKAPAKLVTGGRPVRLDGYLRQPINTVEVLSVNRDRIVLLVVPPRADPHQAHDTMMAAAGPNNASTVDGLLTISVQGRETRSQAAAAQERWETEGGRVIDESGSNGRPAR